MPSQFTSEESNEDANQLGKKLGIELISVSIEDIVNSYDSTLSNLFAGKEKILLKKIFNQEPEVQYYGLFKQVWSYGSYNGNKSEVSVGFQLYTEICGVFSS